MGNFIQIGSFIRRIGRASRTRRATFFAMTLALSSGAAFLGGSDARAAQDRSAICAPDVAKFCPGMKPGQGIWKCLKSNMDKPGFGTGCIKAIKNKQSEKKTRSADCASDLVEFCGSVTHGKGRLKSCLKENIAMLQPKCQRHLK